MSDSNSQGRPDTRPDCQSRNPRPPHLAHHFSTSAQQFESGKLGMWIFLATEVLLFGGLFCAYAVYRSGHPEIFAYAHKYLDKTLGGINTVVLICSSLTMAWAVRCAQRSRRRGLIVLLAATLLFACGFLGIKFVEYEHKWKHGLLWGKHYRPHGLDHPPPDAATATPPAPATATTATTAAIATATTPALSRPTTTRRAGATDERSTIAPAARGPAGLATGGPESEPLRTEPRNVQIFFAVYFLMTGLHGLHVVAGMVTITWVLLRARRGHFTAEYYTPVDLVGLYWHLVDLIWIYLFPLLYLIH